ncbi:MAG: hypothetical protein ACPGVB_11945, partial [Chitinophagales bacterium]
MSRFSLVWSKNQNLVNGRQTLTTVNNENFSPSKTIIHVAINYFNYQVPFMQENSNKKNILKAAASIGFTGIGLALTGFYLPETLVAAAIGTVGGVGGNLLSGDIEKGMETAYSRMTQTTANNHDLQKAFGRALIRACETLEKEYLGKNEYKELRKRDQQSIQTFFHSLRQTAENELKEMEEGNDWFKDQDLKQYLGASTNLTAAKTDLEQKLKAYANIEVGFQPHFVEFVRENLAEGIAFHYLEILKDNQKDNTKVWRAYQLQVQQNLQKTLSELQQNQIEQSEKWQQLTERLAAMPQTEPQKDDYSQIVSAELLLGLGRHFQVLKTQVEELQKEVEAIAAKQAEHIEISKKILEEVKNIETKVEVPKHLTNAAFLSEVFIGRQKDLKAIYERLWNKAQGKGKSENILLLVNGRGGMGKTTLASHYYHQNAHRYQHLAWVFAERSIA